MVNRKSTRDLRYCATTNQLSVEMGQTTSSDEMMKCCWVNSCYLGNRQLAYLGEIEVLTWQYTSSWLQLENTVWKPTWKRWSESGWSQIVRWKKGEDLSSLTGKPVKFRFYLTNGQLYSFWVSPDLTGASDGYVAAGGPGFSTAMDTVGSNVVWIWTRQNGSILP